MVTLSANQLRDLQDFYFYCMGVNEGVVVASWYDHDLQAARELVGLGLYLRDQDVKRRYVLSAEGWELAHKLFKEDFDRRLNVVRFHAHMRRVSLSDETRVLEQVRSICKDYYTPKDNNLYLEYVVVSKGWRVELFADFNIVVRRTSDVYALTVKDALITSPDDAVKLSQLIGVGLQVVEFLNADYQRALDQFQAK